MHLKRLQRWMYLMIWMLNQWQKAASQCDEYYVPHSAHRAFENWRLKTLNNQVGSQAMAGVGDENSYSVDHIKEHHVKSAVKLTHSTDHLVYIVNSIMKWGFNDAREHKDIYRGLKNLFKFLGAEYLTMVLEKSSKIRQKTIVSCGFASELFKSSCAFFIEHIFSVYLIVFGFANLLMCRAISCHGTNKK